MDGTAQANMSDAMSTVRAHAETRLSSSAIPIPSTTLSATLTAVKITVRSATVQNVESLRTSVKFCSPTNEVVPPLWNSAYLPDSCFCSESVTTLTIGQPATTTSTS